MLSYYKKNKFILGLRNYGNANKPKRETETEREIIF